MIDWQTLKTGIDQARHELLAQAQFDEEYASLTPNEQNLIAYVIELQDAIVAMGSAHKAEAESYVRIPKDSIRAGRGITDPATESRYVLVPRAYEDVNYDSDRAVFECGTGPESAAARRTENPNWVWHRAGNLAAIASRLQATEVVTP